MTVFAVHEIKDDITPAEKFGGVRYINKFYIHGDELERNGNNNLIPASYRVNMERALADFVPDHDFLLISGDHLQLLAFTTLLAGRFPFFDVLRWDRQLREYIPIRLSSGVVPPSQAVLRFDTYIGEYHGESRDQDQTREFWDTADLESGLIFHPRKRTP